MNAWHQVYALSNEKNVNTSVPIIRIRTTAERNTNPHTVEQSRTEDTVEESHNNDDDGEDGGEHKEGKRSVSCHINT